MLLKFLSYPIVKLIPFLLFFLGMVFFLPNTTHFFSGAESNLLDSGFYQFDPNIIIRYRIINLLILFGVMGALFFRASETPVGNQSLSTRRPSTK